MQTYGFMRIYDLRRGENDRRTARLDHALCVAMFVAGVVFSDTRMFGLAGAMWQAGLPLFGPEALAAVRWVVGVRERGGACRCMCGDALSRKRRGAPVNGVKLLLAGVTGWFWWYCGRLSTNLLIGVAMFEIYHAVQYNAIVWIYNRRLLERAGERFGPLGFLFRDRLTMLGVYLGAIAAYSSIRFFTAQPGRPHVQRRPGQRPPVADRRVRHVVAAAFLLRRLHLEGERARHRRQSGRRRHGDAVAVERYRAGGWCMPGKWATLRAIAAALVAAEWRYQGDGGAERQAAERAALAALTPDVPEAAMLGSQEALAAGDTARAVELARQAAAARPESHQSQAELAWALIEAGEYAEARPVLERAIELAPEVWTYHCDLGEVCEKLDDLDRAEAEFNRAAELAPAEGEPWDRLTALLLRRTASTRPRRRCGDGCSATTSRRLLTIGWGSSISSRGTPAAPSRRC